MERLVNSGMKLQRTSNYRDESKSSNLNLTTANIQALHSP